MKKIITVFVLLSAMNVSVSRAQLPVAYTTRLQTVLDSVCNKYHINGVTAAVLVPNLGTWKGVHGNSYNGHPLNSNMLMGIGSNTKTYFAAIILRLQERGLLNLDDTIGKWIHNQPNISGQITIKQCLNHTSGLFSYTEYPYFNDSVLANPARVWNIDEMLSFVQAPYFSPGSNWHYSNTNYIVAGIIIKTILGKTIQQCLRDEVLTPQGLSNTILFPYETSALEVAHPWTVNSPSGKLEDMLSWPGYSNNAMFSMACSAGGIMATAEDNVNFWHKLMSGQIINQASLATMCNPIPIGTSFGRPLGYGLGVFRYDKAWSGHTIYSHGGTLPGFLGENAVDSVTGLSIAIISNQDSIDNNKLLSLVVRSLHTVSIQMNITSAQPAPAADATVSIYPNPATQRLHIKTAQMPAGTQLSVADITGRTQMSTLLVDAMTDVSVEVLPAGFYYARITGGNGELLHTQKIQVIK